MGDLHPLGIPLRHPHLVLVSGDLVVAGEAPYCEETPMELDEGLVSRKVMQAIDILNNKYRDICEPGGGGCLSSSGSSSIIPEY